MSIPQSHKMLISQCLPTFPLAEGEKNFIRIKDDKLVEYTVSTDPIPRYEMNDHAEVDSVLYVFDNLGEYIGKRILLVAEPSPAL